MTSNRRKAFYDNKTKLFFAGYIILTLVFLLLIAGNLFSRLIYSVFSPNQISDYVVINPKMLLCFAIIWTIYGYFMAYMYATSKIQNVIFRMKTIFDRIEKGQIHKMSFRKNDPFHDVATSFNNMIVKIDKREKIKKDLMEIIKDKDDTSSKKILQYLDTI